MLVTPDTYVPIGGHLVHASRLRVVDHKGRRIRGVLWCDPSTGEFEALDFKNGLPRVDAQSGTFRTYKRKSRIHLEVGS